MNMGIDNFSNAASKKIPYHDASIVTARSQQSASFVERTCNRYTNWVQQPIEIL